MFFRVAAIPKLILIFKRLSEFTSISVILYEVFWLISAFNFQGSTNGSKLYVIWLKYVASMSS